MPIRSGTTASPGVGGTARSRIAVLAVTAIAVVVVMAAGSTVVRAQDGGIFDFFRRAFSQPAPQPVYQPRWEPQRRAATLGRRSGYGRPRIRVAAAAPRPRGGQSPVRQLATLRTLCVRTCDGFAFPVGRLAATNDAAVHEAACQAACPGADTQLYTMSRGVTEEDPARARSLKDGSLYRELATAFMYRTKLAGPGTCSCHGPDNMSTPMPIAQDRTLRRGDVVVDSRGIGKVFDGSGDAPHPATSFAEFRHSPAIGAPQRRQIDAVLGVSRREAAARDFERKLRVRQAGLEEIRAPAGSAANVQAFRVVTASASFASANVRQVAPTLIVVR